MGIDESQSKYQAKMKVVIDEDRYASELSDWSGVPLDDVKKGPMAKNFKKKFSNAEKRKKRAERWKSGVLTAIKGKE